MADTPQDEDSPSGSYAEEGYEDINQDGAESGMQALGQGPSVAAPPGKTMMMAGAGILLVGFVFYQLFFTEDEVAPPPPEKPKQGAPVAEAEIPVPNVTIEPPPPPPPPPPPIEEITPVPPLPAPPEPQVDFSNQGPTNEQLAARRKSTMLLASGAATPEIETGDSNPLGSMPDAIAQGGKGDPYKSGAARATATHVGDLRKLILQGKIIHAVLETAIDTTFPGPIRGLVSRDVYAESGKEVLIPKGSRLIGNYNADIVRGQARIFIIWTRMIRPDGVDIELASPAVDRLGRTGLEGFVDNRYFEIFSGTALTSVFTIGMAAAAENLFGDQQVTTSQNTDGSQTQTGSPTALAVQESVQNMGSTAARVLGGLIDARPLITVDQGTPVNIFVNKDLEFPDAVTSRIKLIE